MLQAKSEEGKLVYLNDLTEKEKEKLRTTSFYCPTCKQKMRLKKGKVKSWHFSHVGEIKKHSCKTHYSESCLHIAGKDQLYNWIFQSTHLVQKEFTRSHVKQRPDLYCIYQEKTYAVEYQCAAIDADILCNRTKRHIESCDLPVWIIAKDNASPKQKKHVFLKKYPFKYMQDTFSKLPVIYIFEKPFTHFEIQVPLAAFSPQKIFFSRIFLSKSISFFQALQTVSIDFSMEEMKKEWLQAKQTYRLSIKKKPTRFLQFLFPHFPKNHLFISLIPSTVGIPSLFSFHLYSHAIEWQLWFQICILNPMEKGERMSLQNIKRKWCEMIQQGYIVLRPLPLVYRSNHYDALYAYIEYLACLGMLTIKKGYIQKL